MTCKSNFCCDGGVTSPHPGPTVLPVSLTHATRVVTEARVANSFKSSHVKNFSKFASMFSIPVARCVLARLGELVMMLKAELAIFTSNSPVGSGVSNPGTNDKRPKPTLRLSNHELRFARLTATLYATPRSRSFKRLRQRRSNGK